MAEQANDKGLVSFEELLMATVIRLDALTQLLIEKGVRGHTKIEDPPGCLLKAWRFG